MNIEQILWLLDKHASEFNFPVFDNAYLEYGAARLTAFRSNKDWLVVFEVLSFSVREVEFVNDLYAYGSCLELGGLIAEENPFMSTRELPLFNAETNECLADWEHWLIEVNGHAVRFSPTIEEYGIAGIQIKGDPGPGTLPEADLLRFAFFRLGEELFLTDELILSHFPKCKGLSRVLRTTEWQHPDIAGGENPSENIAVRSLIWALAQGDVSLFDPGRPNTNWKNWVGTVRS